jgi:nitroreductase
MDVMDAIKNRRSIRRFLKKDVADDLLMKILEVGNLAPSAGNLQPRDFIVVRDKKIKEQLTIAALGQEFVEEAPVVVVVCANLERVSPYGDRGKELYCIQDAAASIQNMLLTVHDLGLGCCWIGAFNEGVVSKILDLPKNIRPVAILPLGYPDEKPRMPPRINIEDLLHYEKW